MILADKVAVATDVAGVSHVLIVITQRPSDVQVELEPGLVLLLLTFRRSSSFVDAVE
jgi:hypothetical protein